MSKAAPLLTLEPLLESVSKGVEAGGWELSGLQKTTSHQFEGRWEGESTRSAYLFFHSERHAEDASIDVFLDETTRGLSGNLALVVDLAALSDVGDVPETLGELAAMARVCLPEQYRTPLSLRFRLADSRDDPNDAETQVRFKIRIPVGTIGAGEAAVRDFAHVVTRAFERLLDSGGLDEYRAG